MRCLSLTLFVLVGCAGFALLGCGDIEARADAPDTGPAGYVDGATADGSAPMDGGAADAPPENDDDGIWLNANRGAEAQTDMAFAAVESCFDGEDNDAADDVEDGADCDDSDCQDLGSCCVNNADCVGTSSIAFASNFEGCGDDEHCGGDFTTFGSPAPSLDTDTGTLVLAGDDRYDSGWLGGTTIDLSAERVEVDVTFLFAPCDGCLESAGVGFTVQNNLGMSSHVMPLVALRAVGARNEAQLVVGDRVAATMPMGAGRDAWTLTIAPDGVATVGHEGMTMSARFAPDRAARIVLYGHNVNPGEVFTQGARIADLEIRHAPTDSVAAWSMSRDLLIDAPRISAARVGDDDLLALTRDRVVAFYSATSSESQNWMFDGEPWNATDYTFQVVGDERYLWALGPDGNLLRGLMDTSAKHIGVAEPISIAELEWGAISEPALAFGADHDLLIARVGDHLRVAVRAGDTGWRELRGLGDVSAGASHPSLVVHDDVFWLHFTKRRGTRDRIHVMVSDQLVHWRDVGSALMGSGDEDTFDRFSVRAPSMVSDGDELRLYFSGDDLITQSVGMVRRLSPPGRTRL